MSVREDRRYTTDHEWAIQEGDVVRIGITDYAQQELGDVVFVDLPPSGRKLEQGDSFSTVESVKAVSEIYAPVGGEIVEVNEALSGNPELLNQSPFEEGWIVTIRPSDMGAFNGLLDAKAYQAHLDSISK